VTDKKKSRARRSLTSSVGHHNRPSDLRAEGVLVLELTFHIPDDYLPTYLSAATRALTTFSLNANGPYPKGPRRGFGTADEGPGERCEMRRRRGRAADAPAALTPETTEAPALAGLFEGWN
jgi:hypothetical protein